MRVILVAVLYIWASTSHAEVDVTSGSYYLTACQRLLDNAQHTLSGEFNEGLCAGSAEVLTQVGPSVVAFRWCPPDGTTTEQTIKIVVNFLKGHPKRLNEKFINLSKEALREAWSCR